MRPASGKRFGSVYSTFREPGISYPSVQLWEASTKQTNTAISRNSMRK